MDQTAPFVWCSVCKFWFCKHCGQHYHASYHGGLYRPNYSGRTSPGGGTGNNDGHLHATDGQADVDPLYYHLYPVKEDESGQTDKTMDALFTGVDMEKR